MRKISIIFSLKDRLFLYMWFLNKSLIGWRVPLRRNFRIFQFAAVPFEPISDEPSGRYRRFPSLKRVEF